MNPRELRKLAQGHIFGKWPQSTDARMNLEQENLLDYKKKRLGSIKDLLKKAPKLL